jgi:Fuc2NAc and GlcNAc transferase
MPQQYLIYALVILGLSIVSGILIKGILILTLRHQILDLPNERSSHARPTPRGGGLAIVLICLVGWSIYALVWSSDSPWLLWGYALASTLVATVSALDDLRGLSSLKRFLMHMACAILILYTCGWWNSMTLPFWGDLGLGTAGAVLSLLWIVGLTNAYNFMDGIDGIAGAQALLAGLGWIILGSMNDQAECVTLGLLVAAGSAGFLWWNYPPAKIFMGDVGSAFLGFTFAVLPVIAAQTHNRLAVAGVILVWPFVFDSAFTLLRRLSKGENIFQAHRSHLYQRLVQKGWTHGQVSSLYAVLAGIGVAQAAIFVRWPAVGSWFIVVLLPVLAGGLWLLVVYEEKRLPE